MMMLRPMLLAATFASSLAFASPTDDAPKPVSFLAEARVEIDAEGKVVKVEASQDLPEAIRAYIEQQLKTWQYVRRRDPTSGNAATWVALGACAVPAPGGGYTMGLAYHGNGPRIAGGGKLPISRGLVVAVSKARTSGNLDVQFVIGADGKATFESIDGDVDGRTRSIMRPAVESWLEDLRFDPEEIAGKPVATRGSFPLVFKQGDGTRATADELRKEAMQSPQCKQAAAAGQAVDPGMRAVALDSVVDIVPSI